MRTILVVLTLCGTALQAQSIAVTAPSSNQVLSGWSGTTFTVSISSGRSVAMVCYAVDGDHATNPGFGALSTAGCSNRQPFSFAINTYWWFNGPHQLVATAYDAAHSVLATSPVVPFTISNPWPVTCTPTMTVTTGTSVTSTWSGQVSLQGTMTGACASDNLTFNWYVDGLPQETHGGVTGGTATALIDTTAFSNGSHVVAMTVNDTTNGTTYISISPGGASGQISAAIEWSRPVTFSNTGPPFPMETRGNARDIYLTPNSGFNLVPTLVNTDGTTVSSPSFDFLSVNPAAATVSASSGSSATVTGVAQGSSRILVMGEAKTGTDGTPYGLENFFSSASYTVRNSNIGQLIKIGNQANCIGGLYQIQTINTSANFAVLVNPVTGQPAKFATTTTAVCSWALGPTRTIWALVASMNILPHFSSAGNILTSYTPDQSIVMNEGFLSINEFTSQPYNPSFLASICNSGFNTIETPITNQNISGAINQSSFTVGQSSYIDSQVSLVSGCPSLRLFGTADNLTRSTQSVYYNTRGTVSGWSPTATAIVFQSLKSSAVPWIGVSWMDEINNWGQNPLQGPINLGGTSSQNWLSSIAASGGSCTVTTTSTVPGGGWSLFGGDFIIHGSATAGMNTATGSILNATTVDATHFTFPCAGVANGTHNHSNDPGLTIEPLVGGTWFGSDYLHYDAWANILNQVNSVSGRPPAAGSQAAQTNATAVSCWEGGPCGQSISVGGNVVSNISDWADIYWSHAAAENYTQTPSLSALISDSAAAQSAPEEGYWLRNLYGSYDPTKPLTAITWGMSGYYSFDGYPVAITSISGNTITFSAPHGLVNIVPGLSRLWITGSSNAADNKNFFIIAVSSPTTLTIAYAATNSATSGTGGTINFENGDTLALTSINATGVNYPMGLGGDTFTYSGSPTDNVNRHRGQKFTVSGVTGPGAAYFNGTAFYYDMENLIHATGIDGTPSNSANWYRELPASGSSSSSGTAHIIADNLLVKGRTASSSGSYTGGPFQSDPRFSFMTVIEAMLVRAAGHRLYSSMDNPQAYSNVGSGTVHGGFTGAIALSSANIFNQTATAGLTNQHFTHPSVESSYAVPIWHAVSIASMIWSRLARFLFQSTLNSPDYGPAMDCTARSGASGAILVCGNFTNGLQARTFSLAPYLQSGQAIARYVANWQGIALAIVSAGTSSDTIALQPGDVVFYVFPSVFSGECMQPTLSLRLADVVGATDVVVRYNYDLYNLDAANTLYDCGGSGLCTLPVDRKIGTVYYRIIYRDSTGAVLATSDVQTL